MTEEDKIQNNTLQKDRQKSINTSMKTEVMLQTKL